MHIEKAGFTLGEVLVSVVVMAMMFVALFNFVGLAGEIWKRNHATINLTAEADAILDAVERELMNGRSVVVPAAGSEENQIVFKTMVSDFQTTAQSGEAVLRLELATPAVRMRIQTIPNLWASTDSDGGTKQMAQGRYEYDIARHVDDLCVTRETAQLFHIFVRVKNDPWEDQFSKTVEARRTVFLPSF